MKMFRRRRRRFGGHQDGAYDGMIVSSNPRDPSAVMVSRTCSHIFPVMPQHKKATTSSADLAIFVNGWAKPLLEHHSDLQLIANAYGKPTIGIYNATTNNQVEHWIGTALDLVKQTYQFTSAADDTSGFAAFQTLVGLLLKYKRSNLWLLGHSHGALIIACALTKVKQILATKFGRVVVDPLSGIHVETFAGAGNVYPDGPHYVHHINRHDVIPSIIGLTPAGVADKTQHPGKDAKIHLFSDLSSPHSFTTHLKHL